MHRRKSLAVVTCAATLAASRLAMAQLSLTGQTYLETFDLIGTGLPTGWSVRTPATASSLGSTAPVTLAPTSWGDAVGAFKNLASSNGLASSASAATQAGSPDRALGIRQAGAFGDPGAAFTFQIANTIGRSDFSLSFNAELLSDQPRTTTWTVQYALGIAPTTFTDLGTFAPSGFGSTTFSVGAASLGAIANQSQNVWFRVVALSPSAGAGNRDSFAVNNFALGWTGDGAPLVPRTLVWNGSAGDWESANNWLDGGNPATWDSNNPDRAVFSNGALPATVNIVGPVGAGSMAVTAGAPEHVFNGGSLVLSGPLTVDQSVTFNNPVVLGAPSTWTVAAGEVVTVNTGLQGFPFTKEGAGTVVLTGAAPTNGAGATVNAGVVKVTAADANKFTGLGVGQVDINNGTVEIASIGMGTSGGVAAPILRMNNGATLVGSGSAAYGRSGGFTVSNGTTSLQHVVNVRTREEGDTLTFQNSLRQANAVAETFATIVIGGPGRVILESGGTTANDGFAGSWQIDSGILQIGPLAAGGFGTPINALGFKLGDDEATLKPNAVLLNGGILALAVDASNGASGGATSVRNPITLSGGALATATLSTSDGGKFSGNMTFNSGSVLLNDPVNAGAAARNLSFTTETGIPGHVNWGAGALLNVAGTGVLRINRTTDQGGTVSVGAGAAAVFHAGSTVHLLGTLDAFSDGANHVNVTNNGDFLVVEGAKNVGNLDGTGTTNIGDGEVESLTANRVRQTNLKIRENAAVLIRAGVGTNEPARASVVKQLDMAGSPDVPTAKLDLSNNSLVIDYDGALGTQLSDTRKQILAGVTSAGSVGIVSSAVTGVTRSLGYANNADYGVNQKSTFAGQTVDGSSILIKFTSTGDADLDGDTDGGDIATWAQNFTGSLTPGTGPKVWATGDWDYDADTDGADAALWAQSFTGSLNPGLGPVVFVDTPISAGALAVLEGLGITVVPEPGSIGLVGIGLAAAAARRRTRRS